MKNIIIVDDIEVNIDILEKMIYLWGEGEDINVIAATSVKSALIAHDSLLESNYEIDLIISDVHMPTQTGVDLFEVLRGNRGYVGPFCYLTSDNTFKGNAPVFIKPLNKTTVNDMLGLMDSV